MNIILKRGEEYTPILFEESSKKYLDLNTFTHERKWIPTKDTYKFTISKSTPNYLTSYISSIVKRNPSYTEYYGIILFNYNDILAVVVRDKEGNKKILLNDRLNSKELYSYPNTYLTRLKQSFKVHDLKVKDIIFKSIDYLTTQFTFSKSSASFEDYNPEIQSRIISSVMEDLKKELPPLKVSTRSPELEQRVANNWFIVGDWVTITGEDRINWSPEMNKYIGQTVQITKMYNDNEIRFVDDGNWTWKFSDKHFRHAEPEEIPELI